MLHVEAVADETELLRLHNTVRRSRLDLLCAPTAPPQPPRDELLRLAAKSNMTVYAAYEDERPLMYAIHGDDGATHWLCIAELNAEAIDALVKRGLADGRVYGQIANPDLRAVFEQLGHRINDEHVEGVRED